MAQDILSWLAVAILATSYWFQIYRNYQTKNTESLSLRYYIGLGLGFSILGIEAWMLGSVIFMTKQISTVIPVLIIIAQIYYYRTDKDYIT